MNTSRNTTTRATRRFSDPPVAAATLQSSNFGEDEIVVEAKSFRESAAAATKEGSQYIPQDYNNDEGLPTANAEPVDRRGRGRGRRPPMRRHSYGYAVGTGEDLLRRMKLQRKAATVNSGLWGGLFGLLLGGPIGAVGVGAGSALLTKVSLKGRERAVKRQLKRSPEGLQQPVYYGYYGYHL